MKQLVGSALKSELNGEVLVYCFLVAVVEEILELSTPAAFFDSIQI